MTASLLFHQRYRVAVLTPACLANSCADTDAIPRVFSRRYAARRTACFDASLRGRPRGRGLGVGDPSTKSKALVNPQRPTKAQDPSNADLMVEGIGMNAATAAAYSKGLAD